MIDEPFEPHGHFGRIDYLMRVLCRDIDHYNELSDFMSRGELQGYPLELLIEPHGRD